MNASKYIEMLADDVEDVERGFAVRLSIARGTNGPTAATVRTSVDNFASEASKISITETIAR